MGVITEVSFFHPDLGYKKRSFLFFVLILHFFKLKFFFNFLATSCGMRELNSPPRIKPMPPAVEAWSVNHWTTKEVLRIRFLKCFLLESCKCLHFPSENCNFG